MVKRFKFIIQKLYRIRLAGATVIGIGPYKLSQTEAAAGGAPAAS